MFSLVVYTDLRNLSNIAFQIYHTHIGQYMLTRSSTVYRG